MPSRTHTLVTTPDLIDDWDTVCAEQAAAAMIANRAEGDVRDDARARHDAATARRADIEAAIIDATRTITMTRLAPREWMRILAAHPARDDDPYDARLGVNTDTFADDLMPAVITSVVDGHGTPVDLDWPTVAATMSPTDYQDLTMGAIALHTRRDAVPFSLPDSPTTPG